MNVTTNQVTITINTTAQPYDKYAIRERFERDARTGQTRIVETVRGDSTLKAKQDRKAGG
jgi:hypothetical protein